MLILAASLTDLLAAENKQQKLAEFVGSALSDLKRSGAVDAVIGAMKRSKATK
jgi:hypothetical protein